MTIGVFFLTTEYSLLSAALQSMLVFILNKKNLKIILKNTAFLIMFSIPWIIYRIASYKEGMIISLGIWTIYSEGLIKALGFLLQIYSLSILSYHIISLLRNKLTTEKSIEKYMPGFFKISFMAVNYYPVMLQKVVTLIKKAPRNGGAVDMIDKLYEGVEQNSSGHDPDQNAFLLDK